MEAPVRITSIGYAVPDRYVYTQEEVLTLLGYTSPLARRIFKNTEIQKRHFWTNPIGRTPDELRMDYEEGVVEMGKRAVEATLDGREKDVGALVFVSCTNPHPITPGPAHHIAKALGLPKNCVLINEMQGGCQGGLPGLRLAYLLAKDLQKPTLALSVELCSTTFYPSPETDLENLVSNSIFGDMASCALVEPSNDPQFPEILDFINLFDHKNLTVTGYRWVPGESRVKVVLSRDLPKIIPPLLAQAIRELLRRNGLTLEDVKGWAVHNGGVAVLDALGRELGVDDRWAFRHSWGVLKEYGNCSSATVGAVAKRVHHDPSCRGGYVVGASAGAGCEVSAVLCRYG